MQKLNESEVEKLLEETSNLIDAMLEVVLPDFVRITNLLKSFNPHDTDEVRAKAYGCVMQELQYYDTLTQKMEHIKTIHKHLLQSMLSNAFAQSNAQVSGLTLVRLNHIQFQVACFEYLASVNEIESNLVILLDIKTNAHHTFQYSNLLLSASRFINKNFVLLEGALQNVADADLKNSVDRISALYSMESERNVLHAYLNKPLLHDTEIEPLHRSNRQSEIDLF